MSARKGFTLVETMVVMVIMVLVMSSIYMMILYYRDVAGTEQARVRQTQESRYLLSVFSSELKNAGAVMTLVNTGSFLSTPPHFNGIYPLNNDDFADGVILACGDPNAVGKLVSEADMSTDTALSLNVLTSNPPWADKDKGILIGPSGYYVFEVLGTPSGTTLTIRPQAVYYSGLLNTAHYVDSEASGKNMVYPANAPVMRLDDFSIYLVQQRYDGVKGRNIRELVRVSDCGGDIADVLGDASGRVVKGVIAENIWDLQLSYIAYPSFPDVVTSESYFSNGGLTDLSALLNTLRLKTMKEVLVNVVALTDDYAGRGTVTYQLPQLADRDPETLPAGKYNYRTLRFRVQPRNFNIKL
jgi:prepilin-type N-terminal cleavage/methylation domain-containing protein